MSGWRPELTATVADTEALHTGLRIVPPPAAHARCAAACAGSRAGASASCIAADMLAVLFALAGTYLLAAQIGAAGGHRADLAARRASCPWSRSRGWRVFGTYRLYEGQTAAIAPRASTRSSTLFHALLAGSLVLLVVGQGLKKGFDWSMYSPLEARCSGLALALVPCRRCAASCAPGCSRA